MAKAESKSEVVVPPQGGQVQAFDPELAAMLAQDAGLGKENIRTADMAVPRLTVLQPLSPQVTPGKPEYLEAAKPGMIYDSVMNYLYSGSEGINCIPVHFRATYLEWIPRKAGGGFVGDLGLNIDETKYKRNPETKLLETAEGHEVVLTKEYFAYVLLKEGGIAPAIISMAKTQERKSKVWNTMINQFEIPDPRDPTKMLNPAMFYRSYHLTTTIETNDKGSWFGWKIEPSKNTFDLPNGRELYLKARQFHADIAAGKVNVAPPVEGAVEDENAPM